MNRDRGPVSFPLHVEATGRGPPLVLLHGFGAHSYTWRHWTPELARHHRVLEVDLKGFGSAPKPRDDAYGPLDHARLVLRLFRDRELEGATLVGHSFGGTVSLLLTLLLLEGEPERLDRLVLVAAGAYPQTLPRYMRLARIPFLGRLMLRLIPSRTLARAALRSTYRHPDRVTDSQVEAYAQGLRSRGGHHAVVSTARQVLTVDPGAWTSRYPEIGIPTLLLWGDRDPIVPVETGRRLERDLPDARLVLVEECGHVPQEEKPRASLEPVLAFLRESSGAAP